MAHHNLLDTSTVSFSEILGNGKVYKVPTYQRDYSWKAHHWQDLWEDIVTMIKSNGIHYMGSIVLQNKGDKHYTIIDGQQRLATLILLVLAVVKSLQDLVDNNIDANNNTERIQLLKKKFLGDKDPASLTYAAKLELNENNNNFFQSHLMVFRKPINDKTLGDSDKLLWKAYNYYVEKVGEYFVNSNNGERIADFLNNNVAENLKFIQIIVENELSAYTVFETLNYRGEKLTVSDLLKNFLFSLATQADLPHIKSKWRKTVDTIGLDKFPTFLRHYWISKNELISERHLFKSLKDSIKDSPQVVDLLDELEQHAQLYNALQNSSDRMWAGQREIIKRIREIELFKEKQALPALMAAYFHFSTEEFIKVLRIFTVVSFRYNIIGGYNPNRKESIYHEIALKITNNEKKTAKDIAAEIKPVYIPDKTFKNDFASAIINARKNRKLVRYILFELENNIAKTDNDFELNPATIEHILPENAGDDWAEYFPASKQELFASKQELFVYRLGNYTLLEDDKNRECGTKPYKEKKNIYSTSQYKITSQIDTLEWVPMAIDIRQEQMAEKASTCWRIPYFDEKKKTDNSSESNISNSHL